MYVYAEQKKAVFTEEGQVKFLKILVTVEANGHHDYSGTIKSGNVSLKIEIFPA